MKTKYSRLFLVLALLLGVLPTTSLTIAAADEPTLALSPQVYHHVARVVWVVSDVDAVVKYWQGLGIRDIHHDGIVKFPNLMYRGSADAAKAKQVMAHIDGLDIQWIQPISGGKFWKDALHRQGDGIRAVVYNAGSPEEFDRQIKYFASKHVDVVVEDSWKSGSGRGRIAYLDTSAQGGGNTIALIDDPAVSKTEGAANQYPLEKITHFAWVVNDVRKVDAYYTSLGFKPFSAIDHNISLDRVYRGQPGNFEMWLGWDRTGDAPLEWVQQITGDDVYVEYGKKHGEGFHHLGVNVKDMDEAIKLMTERGAPATEDASWKTSKGKGRAVYLDTDPHGGVTVELIYDPH